MPSPRTFRFGLPASLLALMLQAPLLQAQVTTFTTYADWFAAVTGVGTDEFAGLPPGGFFPSISRTTTGVAYTYSASATSGLFTGDVFGSLTLSTNYEYEPITFNGFTPGVSAFGGTFLLTDLSFGALAGSVTVSWVVAGTGSGSESIAYDGGSTLPFFGVVASSALTSISISYAGGAVTDPFVTVGSVYPAEASSVSEPYAVLLLAPGFVGLAAAARRRRTRGGSAT